MRVLFISQDASRSGAPTALLQILRGLKQYHHEIEFDLLLLNDGPLMSEFARLCPVLLGKHKYTIPHGIFRHLKIGRYLHPYLHLCKKGRYDCIYANTILTFEAAIKIKKKLEIPLVGHIHEAESSLYKVGITREQIEEFDQLLTVSELAAKAIADIYQIPREAISIQHPFSFWVEQYLKGDILVKSTDSTDCYTIGLLFSDNWRKSVETVSMIVKLFDTKYHHIKYCFEIVGPISNQSRYRLEFDFKRMKLEEKVHFVGAVNNPLDYFAHFDVFLLLSREESYSLTAEESAIVETPIVGYEGATGAAEWIQNGAGILVPYMDIDKLTDSLYLLYTNEQLRKSYGKQGRKMICEMYENEKKMDVIADIIKSYSCSRK